MQSGLMTNFLSLEDIKLSELTWVRYRSHFTQILNGSYGFQKMVIIFVPRATEKWSQGLGLTTLEHQMTDYEYYPELFIVSEEFCSK